MEVITGIITLQMIFSKYWEAFKKWHTGEIREAVISNVERILKCSCRTIRIPRLQMSKM
jgi:hypothetical protein